MQLLNEFNVGLPPEEAWILLTDLEKVAPCLPGASITSRDGDDFHGQAKIKLGPITAQYTGVAQFQELDGSNYRAVLLARGKDSRGQGDASATVIATLVPNGDGTRVTVETELALSGKVAQFGRGVLAEVSGSLMTLFAERLEAMVNEQASPTASASAAQQSEPTHDLGRGEPAASRSAVHEDEVLDVFALAGGVPWAKALPAAGTVVAIAAALVSVFAAGYASARARAFVRQH